MTTWLVLLGLVAAAGVPYILWTRLEARGHKRAQAVHADVLQMGDDVVPVSLHPEIDLDDCIGSGACVRACPEKEVLGITDGRARLINPLSCIGHSACMQACPVGAIKLVFGTAKRGVELPMLTPDFETNQKGIYIIGELTGMGLIRNATMQGKQTAATIARSGRRGGAGDLDVIVVGAGPAGIAAALGCMAQGLTVQIVEQSAYGGTIAHYPRAKVVMTGTLDLPGFGTVRRKTMSKEELLELWGDIRGRVQLDVKEGVRVDAIVREGDRWRVVGGPYSERAASVVLALGRRGAPKTLGVPGEELPKVVYRLLEPEPFAGTDVMVVGGGNAAADCAIALAEAGVCRSVSLSYRRKQLARLRGSVRQRLEELIAERRVVAYLGTELKYIANDYVALAVGPEVTRVANDHVIVQIGGTSPSELLKTIGIDLVEKRGVA
jgi:thioredoxin reductase/NAD-dependent dihydropyrimidine dehydrogenase PreA subunit